MERFQQIKQKVEEINTLIDFKNDELKTNYQKLNADLNEIIAKLTQELTNLDTELDIINTRKIEEIADLTSKITKLTEEKAILLKDVPEAQSTIAKLQAENTRKLGDLYRKKIQPLFDKWKVKEDTSVDFSEKIPAAVDKLLLLVQHVKLIEDEEKLNETKGSNEQVISQLQRNIQGLHTRLTELKQQTNNLNEEAQDLDKKIAVTSSDNQGLLADNQGLRARRDAIIEEQQELNNQQTALINEIHQLEEHRANTLNPTIGNLTAERDRLAADLGRLAAEGNGLNQEIVMLAAERNRLAAEGDGLNQTKDNLTTDLGALTQEINNLTTERDRLNQTKVDLTTDLGALNQEIDNLTGSIESLTKENDDLTTQKNNLIARQTFLTVENRNTQQLVDEIGQITISYNKAVTEFEMKISNLTEALEKANLLTEGQKNQINENDVRIKKLENELQSSESNCRDSQKDFEDLKEYVLKELDSIYENIGTIDTNTSLPPNEIAALQNVLSSVIKKSKQMQQVTGGKRKTKKPKRKTKRKSKRPKTMKLRRRKTKKY